MGMGARASGTGPLRGIDGDGGGEVMDEFNMIVDDDDDDAAAAAAALTFSVSHACLNHVSFSTPSGANSFPREKPCGLEYHLIPGRAHR